MLPESRRPRAARRLGQQGGWGNRAAGGRDSVYLHGNIRTTIGVLALWATAALGTESSVPHLKADEVHALGFDGFGVTVTVIDTGLDPSHPGLSGHIRPGSDSLPLLARRHGRSLPEGLSPATRDTPGAGPYAWRVQEILQSFFSLRCELRATPIFVNLWNKYRRDTVQITVP
jgi:hypothetical protein